jgi:catechol 2,3-dioxygenase-like lactoylglutathione lyase family enzyme
MLTYVYFGTNDLARAIAFYNAALAPLGMQRCITGDAEWDRVAAGAAYVRDPDGNKIAALCRGIRQT